MVGYLSTGLRWLSFPELPPSRFDRRSDQSDYSCHEDQNGWCREAGYEEQNDPRDHGDEPSKLHGACVDDYSSDYRPKSQQCLQQPNEYRDRRSSTAG